MNGRNDFNVADSIRPLPQQIFLDPDKAPLDTVKQFDETVSHTQKCVIEKDTINYLISVNKYKKILYGLIDQQFILNPYRVFQHLLSAYITNYSYSATLLAPPHLPFAKSLKNIIKNNEEDTINYLDGYLKSNLIKQNDSFFGLLIAYFYYYQDCYGLKDYDFIYSQIVLPLHLFCERMENDEINLLVAKTDDPDEKIRRKACKELGNILIPEEKREWIIKKLIIKLDDKDLWVTVYSCEALGKINIPDQKRDWICDKLLSKIKVGNSIGKEACKSLGKMTISDKMSEIVIEQLFCEFSSYGPWRPNDTHDVICKTLTTIIISEEKWKIITDKLLVKVDDANFVVRYAAYNFLGNIPIPKEKYETVVNKLYSHLTKNQHSDFDTHYNVSSRLESALRKVTTPNTESESLVNKFLIEIDNPTYCCRENAFWLLSRLQVSEDEINRIIHRMFEIDAPYQLRFLTEFLKNKNLSDSNTITLIDKLILNINKTETSISEALGLIKIPEDKFQIVFETLLLQLDKKDINPLSSSAAVNTLEKIIKKYESSTIISQIINSILEKIENDKNLNYFRILGNIPIQHANFTRVMNVLLNKANHGIWYIRELACETLSKIKIPGDMEDTVLAKIIDVMMGIIDKSHVDNRDVDILIAASKVIKKVTLSETSLEIIIDKLLTKDIRYIFKVLASMPIPISRREIVFNAMIKNQDYCYHLAALSRMDICENHREIISDKFLIQFKHGKVDYESLEHINLPVNKLQKVIGLLINKIADVEYEYGSEKACEAFIALHKKMSQAECIASLIRLEHETTSDIKNLPTLLKFTQYFRKNIVVDSVLSKLPNVLVKEYKMGGL